MKLGILGAGGIASTMAKTVAGMKDVEAYAVAARDLGRAQVFAQKYEVKKAYGSYEEMLADDEVELVYIATPHSHHYLHAKMCLEAGKHVLCEKAFTVNAEQAQKLFDLAKEKKLLITEAIWTRYMPSRKMINDIIESGVIGEVTAVTANLSYTVSHVERIRKFSLQTNENKSVCAAHTRILEMVLHGTADELGEALESHLNRYKLSVEQARSVHPEFFTEG